ncbi:MAG: hypothetical protein QM767_20560 [Anaeromyxobacter sp.]
MSLRRSGPLALGIAALLAAGCTDTVSQSPSPDEIVFANFVTSPTASIPVPNDLALQAAGAAGEPTSRSTCSCSSSSLPAASPPTRR